MARSTSLTDTQLILLSKASQREDQLLAADRLRGGVATRVADCLLAAGLVEEVDVGWTDPHWRIDADAVRIGLRITAAGLAAIDGPDGDTILLMHRRPKNPAEMPRRLFGSGPGPPRLLGLRQLICSRCYDGLGARRWMSWLTRPDRLPHSTRAALTGLRHRGLTIERQKGEGGRSVYRDVSPMAGE
jgi:hypothetical protein